MKIGGLLLIWVFIVVCWYLEYKEVVFLVNMWSMMKFTLNNVCGLLVMLLMCVVGTILKKFFLFISFLLRVERFMNGIFL